MPRARFSPTKLPLPQRIVERRKFAKQPLHYNPKAFTLGVPQLWNAHRVIKYSKGIPIRDANALRNKPELLADGKEPFRQTEDPKRRPSQDVIDFMDKHRLLPEEKYRLLRNPAWYFSFPQNVPETLRKQIYLPNFVVVLRRTPHLPPAYASFKVPLWFNKLDMKSYLKQVYDVDIVHVRSYVSQGKVSNRTPRNPNGRGQLYRRKNVKRMTVELEEPFVWPEAPRDLSPWNYDEYWTTIKGQLQQQEQSDRRYKVMHHDPDHRKSIAQQARDLLAGKDEWAPTWRSMPADVKMMEPVDPRRVQREMLDKKLRVAQRQPRKLPSSASSSLPPPQSSQDHHSRASL